MIKFTEKSLLTPFQSSEAKCNAKYLCDEIDKLPETNENSVTKPPTTL